MAKEEKFDNKKPRVMSKEELQQALIDNFINLQKVMTNLAVKFEELSGNMSKLLQLFEISAKTFAEKYNQMDSTEHLKKEGLDEEYIKKLDALMDQNKIISRGIMLIEERIRERGENPPQIQKPEPMHNNLQQNQTNQGYIQQNPINRPQMDRFQNRQPPQRY